MALHEVSSQYIFSHDWFSRNLPQFERSLAHLKGTPCRLLEVGSYEGRSTTWLIDNIATHRSATIDAVDLEEHPRLRANIISTGHAGKVRFHLGRPSSVVLREMPFDAFDFAYIDGCHWTIETLEDAVLAFPLVKAGEIIGFDDYKWDDPKMNQEGRPKEAIDAFLRVYADKIELLHRRYQVWVRKKQPHEVTRRRLQSVHGYPAWMRQPRKRLVQWWKG